MNIVIRLKFLLFFLGVILTLLSQAQGEDSARLNIGDSAPPLVVSEWIKGTPIRKFEKGMIYVIEFWATWCKPCIESMPRLSVLAGKYKNKITFLGIDVMEIKTTSKSKIKVFVESMGDKMDYSVGIEDSNFMVHGWIDAAAERDKGIPRTFVINDEGQLAWIGHPQDLEKILPHLVNNTWNIKEAMETRNMDRRLEEMDREIGYTLNTLVGNASIPGDLGQPDSALLIINEIVSKEPGLKFRPMIAFHTFSALLKTSPEKAYEYGKSIITTPTIEKPPYHGIIDAIKWYSDKIELPLNIYRLCAEFYQAEIDNYLPEYVNAAEIYNKMAEMYCRAHDKQAAIGAQQKALDGLKKKNFSKSDLATFELRLKKYEKM